MLELSDYDDLVVESFRKDAVRTVVLIDNAFPNYADIALRCRNLESDREANVNDSPREIDKASELYSFFRRHDVTCDIDNDIANLATSGYERARKCDLIVLDYHLTQNDDATPAIELLAKLADTQHFNLVVVCTNDEDLSRVWLEIAANLRGGWRPPDAILDEEAYEEWDELLNVHSLTACSRETLAQFICGNRHDQKHCDELRQCIKDTQHLGRNFKKAHEAHIAHSVAALVGTHIYRGNRERAVYQGQMSANDPWLICENVLLAITTKKRDLSEGDGIFEPLDAALRTWHPNPVRLLMSQLQNIVEDFAPAYDHRLGHDDATQAGWLFLAEKERATVPRGIPSSAIENLCGHVAGAFHDLLVKHPKLTPFVERLLESISDKGLVNGSEFTRLAHAMKQAGTRATQAQVMHALNAFLSSVSFVGPHVTTGTILYDRDANVWWLCVQPGCDLVPEQRKKNARHCEMAALRLEPMPQWNQQLNEATKSRTIYVKYEGVERCFGVLHRQSQQISPEVLLLTYGLDQPGQNGNKSSYYRVRVFRLRYEKDEPVAEEHEMFAVAQLREPYASRFLHQAGHHASRIAVDFVDLQVKDELDRT
ncbi:MAG: hypothetical protein GXX96_04960 [Planctomycetaceae bacterium]|nr:hypothetical protein [Planctomycetaceae bacterium]